MKNKIDNILQKKKPSGSDSTIKLIFQFKYAFQTHLYEYDYAITDIPLTIKNMIMLLPIISYLYLPIFVI